ncbi:MAG TPA: hypothetical protein VF708_17520 [Pyrinomonadaceae bacterium]
MTDEKQSALRAVRAAGTLRRSWSIGIYTGKSPLRLSSAPEIQNPVLTSREVSDVRASFVADPFMVVEDGNWYMFFEVMNEETDKGEIGLAVSRDGLHWQYRQIVLREPFHLSYPYVFRWKDDYYMIPETLAMDAICLYRATLFPTRWTCAGTLLSGRCADTSIFRFDSRWWMFTCAPIQKSDTLRLYYSDRLTDGWHEHPRSPVVEGNARIARPGGRVIQADSRLIRFTQDCYDRYGSQVRAFEITDLTRTTYSEREDAASPILCAASDGWNSEGMHHVDPVLTPEGRWVACVDGLSSVEVEEPLQPSQPEVRPCS